VYVPFSHAGLRMEADGRINSIDKSRLSADSYSYSGNGIAWKARVILFVGFAFMAGGLAGSVTVLVLKYLVHHYPFPTLGFGVSNVVANALVMLRYFPTHPGFCEGGVDNIVRLCCGLRRMLRRMSMRIIYRFEMLSGNADGVGSHSIVNTLTQWIVIVQLPPFRVVKDISDVTDLALLPDIVPADT
jgi:hypothetical protein